jgi:hypothetical protein
MVRAAAARIAREVESFLSAYIDPLFLRRTLALQKHSKSRNWYPMRGVRPKLHSERTGFSTLLLKTKGRGEGDLGVGVGNVRAAGLYGDPVRRGEGEEMGKGRQPNPGRGHPPWKGNKLSVQAPGYAGAVVYGTEHESGS